MLSSCLGSISEAARRPGSVPEDGLPTGQRDGGRAGAIQGQQHGSTAHCPVRLA